MLLLVVVWLASLVFIFAYLRQTKSSLEELGAKLTMDILGDHGWIHLTRRLSLSCLVYTTLFWTCFVVLVLIGPLYVPDWVLLTAIPALILFKSFFGPFQLLVAVDADRTFIAQVNWFSIRLAGAVVDEVPRAGWFDLAGRKLIGFRVVYHAASGAAVPFLVTWKQRSFAEDLVTRFSVPSVRWDMPGA